MDQRIFDQLDRLERGARIETRPPPVVYNNSSAEFSGYDMPEQAYGDPAGYDQYEFADQPMVLDSFGGLPIQVCTEER